MTATESTVVPAIFAVVLAAVMAYAAGRLHQWYVQTQERHEAWHSGYDSASRSLFHLATRVSRPGDGEPALTAVDRSGRTVPVIPGAAVTALERPAPSSAAQPPAVGRPARGADTPAPTAGRRPANPAARPLAAVRNPGHHPEPQPATAVDEPGYAELPAVLTGSSVAGPTPLPNAAVARGVAAVATRHQSVVQRPTVHRPTAHRRAAPNLNERATH